MNEHGPSDCEMHGAIDWMRQQHQQQQQQQAQAQARPLKVVPLWSNLDLPPQGYSTVAHAAHILQRVPAPVPENWDLAPTKRRRQHNQAAHRLPRETSTRAFYEAFAALSLVSALPNLSDVKPFVAAELAELRAAAGLPEGPAASGLAAAPRGLVLTVLISNTSLCTDRTFLLDAMALLAHRSEWPSHSGRAAREVRMAVLTNEQAIHYVEKTGNHVLGGKGGKHAELVFAHVAGDGARKARYTSLEHGGSATRALEVLVVAIAKLFKKAKVPLPPSLAAACSATDPDAGAAGGANADALDEAYAKAHLAVNGEFWDRVCRVEAAPKLEFQLRFGEGPEEQTFVKLAPRELQHLNDPGVHFGMLMFREGADSQKSNYVLDAMMQERQGKPQHAPIGLRPPVMAWEREAEPHILSVSASSVSFRGDLCCYTTRGVPGEMMAPFDNASMPCLHYALAAYTDEYAARTFVLPCTQDQIDEDYDLHCRAQWQAAKEGFYKYSCLCGVDDEPRGAEEDGEAKAPQSAPFEVKQLKGVASIEEGALAAMIGIPLGSAFRLGEVNDVVARSKQELKAIRAFLEASMRRLGRNASIADALRACVDVEADRAALAEQVDRLRDDLRGARAAAPPAATVEIAPCSAAVAEMCLVGMGLVSVYSMAIPSPMTTGKIVGIGRVLYAAKQATPRPNTQYDDAIKVHAPGCKRMSAVGVAAHLAEKMHDAPLYAVVVMKDRETVEFFKTSERGNGQIAKVSGMELMQACSRPEVAPLLVRYDVASFKISALVPKA